MPIKPKPNKPPHPNRQLVLQDLIATETIIVSKVEWSTTAIKTYLTNLEARLPGRKDFIDLATKKDLLAAEERLGKLITRARFDWTVGPVTNKVQQEKEQMIIKLTNEQQVTVTLKPKTDGGRTAKLDGVPTFEVISGESTVTAAADGLSALIVSSDNPGDTQILVKADADLGEGVEEISEILEVQVGSASAKNLGIVVGTPEVKPAPPA